MADGSQVNGSTAGRDRYAAVVAALLDVRTDEATARFDDEVAKAVANQRLDAQTARTLRWWQRASVQSAENYAASVVSGLLEVHEQADRAARHAVEGAAAAWETAQAVTNAHQAADPPAVAQKAPVAELAAVRLLTPRPRSAESTQAVRTALARGGDVDLIATTISTPNSASPDGKDGHANPATSA